MYIENPKISKKNSWNQNYLYQISYTHCWCFSFLWRSLFCPFILFSFQVVIVLSVLLWFTTSDYPIWYIFKLFFCVMVVSSQIFVTTIAIWFIGCLATNRDMYPYCYVDTDPRLSQKNVRIYILMWTHTSDCHKKTSISILSCGNKILVDTKKITNTSGCDKDLWFHSIEWVSDKCLIQSEYFFRSPIARTIKLLYMVITQDVLLRLQSKMASNH